MHAHGPDIAPALLYRLIPQRLKVAGMLIEAHSRCDFRAGAATAATPGDQIGTDVSRDRRVIPFRDDVPLRAVSLKDRISS